MFDTKTRIAVGLSVLLLFGPPSLSYAQSGHTFKAPIRAVVTKATQPITIDGNLDEFSEAIATPVEYFNPDAKNRPAQFLYLWDDEAFYVGLRTLDEKIFSPVHPLWEGDAVEWYFDTRRDDRFRDQTWGPGSVHCFWTAMEKGVLNPRFCLRPGYLDAIPEKGVEVAARKWQHGLTVEFKLPWENFPDFKARAGEIIGVDAELSYSDGGPRSDRSFVFGSPLSVQQPGNLANVQLIDRFKDTDWSKAAAVMMPIRIDTAWSQAGVPQVQGRIAMPVNQADQIGRITFQLVDLTGKVLGEFPANKEEVLQQDGHFVRRLAQWPADLAPPGTYNVIAVIHNKDNIEIARVAPRRVSVNMQQGY